MEDKQLHTNLRQAKLAVRLLELQAGASKERLESALAQWQQSDYMSGSASSESGSDSSRFCPPTLLFQLSPTSISHLPRVTIARKHTASRPVPMLDVAVWMLCIHPCFLVSKNLLDCGILLLIMITAGLPTGRKPSMSSCCTSHCLVQKLVVLGNNILLYYLHTWMLYVVHHSYSLFLYAL